VQVKVEVNGQVRQVVVNRSDGRFVVSVGDRTWTVDAVQVDGHLLSLLIEQADVRLKPDATTEKTNATTMISREVAVTSDQATGQVVVGIGALPVPVGLNTRRRRRHDDGAGAGTGPQRIVAPMPGKVVRVLGRAGDSVAHRQPVVVIEAMKMENELRASRDGTVTDVLVQEGQSVEAGTLLAIIAPA
jgi:biotin carboxyl carrier protein